ncbi:hypothetical protein [Pseudonocardia sp. DSM 110487]|uniref:hypothetical protein n=1 Tax=Pseudonocardia sp. DSM 110487 TaxID=2865833 RepID=UPI002105FF05|nr:hypothetical protein [Pseudonocardia sp. DSM 110487]
MATMRVRGRMRPRTRKGVLVAHIVAAGAWIGLDVMLGVLVFTPPLTSDPAVAALCYQAMPLLFWPILVSGLTSLVTGVVLGMGTHHGLVRHWWVLVKLVLNIALTSLVVVLLGPGMAEAAEAGRRLAAGVPVDIDLSNMVFPPIVSGTSLVVATVLAVYKPWGRVRRSAAGS